MSGIRNFDPVRPWWKSPLRTGGTGTQELSLLRVDNYSDAFGVPFHSVVKFLEARGINFLLSLSTVMCLTKAVMGTAHTSSPAPIPSSSSIFDLPHSLGRKEHSLGREEESSSARLPCGIFFWTHLVHSAPISPKVRNFALSPSRISLSPSPQHQQIQHFTFLEPQRYGDQRVWTTGVLLFNNTVLLPAAYFSCK